MSAAGRLAAFGLALALIFGGGWAIGHAAGPLRAGEHAAAADQHAAAAGEQAGDTPPPGLSAVEHGYTLVPQTAQLNSGVPGAYQFRITDRSGAAVTRFAVEHGKRLHLVVVRRDGAHFQHLHPELAADGTWSVPLTVPAAGVYRVFADFRPGGGPKTTLAADLLVPGELTPAPAAGESRTARVAGYQVRLDGDLAAGASATVRATIARGDRPVTDLQPYLESYGHLVVLRGSDLAYLHVHPDGEPGDGRTAAGPVVTFTVDVPTAGRYLLYLDFQHADVVHTAHFVLEARA